MCLRQKNGWENDKTRGRLAQASRVVGFDLPSENEKVNENTTGPGIKSSIQKRVSVILPRWDETLMSLVGKLVQPLMLQTSFCFYNVLVGAKRLTTDSLNCKMVCLRSIMTPFVKHLPHLKSNHFPENQLFPFL